MNLQKHIHEVDGAQLSGGERRRLELARALLREPRVLLLDEPFAGVDPIAVADIKEAIRQVRDHGIGVLVTDHNVTETLRLCDRAYLIYDGRIVAEGTPQQGVADSPLARRGTLGPQPLAPSQLAQAAPAGDRASVRSGGTSVRYQPRGAR